MDTDHAIYVFQNAIVSLMMLIMAFILTPIIILKIHESFKGDKKPKKLDK